jgi:hypothetical protein
MLSGFSFSLFFLSKANPKNKFAVLPENTSRGVSPVIFDSGFGDNPSNRNSGNFSQQSSPGVENYKSINNTNSNYRVSPTPNSQFFPSSSSSASKGFSDNEKSSSTFSSSSSNLVLRAKSMTPSNSRHSPRNSFDDKAINDLFDELNLNDNKGQQFKSSTNSSQIRSVSGDSWDEDLDNYQNKNDYQIPKTKSLHTTPSFLSNNSASSTPISTPSATQHHSLSSASSSTAKTRCSPFPWSFSSFSYFFFVSFPS